MPNLTMSDVVRAMFGARPAKKQPNINREQKPRKEPKEFMVRLPDGKWVAVTAQTKSEARAVAKKDLGLQDRLPAGTTASSW